LREKKGVDLPGPDLTDRSHAGKFEIMIAMLFRASCLKRRR
jgi:hypothetical protein